MRPRWFRAAALFALLTAASLYAQMPAPPPELKKLDFLTGDWAAEGTVNCASALVGCAPEARGTPAAKWTVTTHGEWLGSYFLVEHSDGDIGAMGKMTEFAVTGYDPDRKVYTHNAFNSFGSSESATGTTDGDTWTWLTDEHTSGTAIRGRYTMKVLSPTSYTMKFELSQDGANWTTAMEGKATKK